MREPSPYFINRTVNLSPKAATPLIVGDSHSFRESFDVVRRHSSMIISLVGTVLLVTALVVFTMTPQYTAVSTIMIELQAPQVLDIKELMPESTEKENDFFYTQYEVLRSRTLASEVIHDLGLQKTPPIADTGDGLLREVWKHLRWILNLNITRRHSGEPLEISGIKPKVIDNYIRHLSITPETFTRLVKVAFTTPDPDLSARIANAHVAAYIQRGLELRSQSSEEAQRFLEGKLVELRDRVEKSEAALNAYRHDRGIVGFDIDDKNRIVLQRLEDLNKALTAASTERIGLEAQVETIKHDAFESVPDVVSNPLIQRLKEEYSSIESQYAGLAEQFTSDYPPLAEIAAKRDQAQNRLRQEIQKITDSIQVQYRTAVDREQKLQRQIADEKARAMSLQNASLKDAILAREVDTNHELYKSVLERMKQMEVAAQVRASNVSVVDEAETPEYASSPRRLLTLGLSGSLALIIGIAAAFFLEHLDDTFKSPEEVDSYLNLPTLGMVPDFIKSRSRLAYGSRNGMLAASDGPSANGKSRPQLEIQKLSTEIFLSRHPLSATSEAYRTIRAAIMLSRAESPPKTILVVSSTEREGKTVTAVNTALAFGQLGGQVLLVDADLRHSRCHKVLGIDNHIGLTQFLTGLREWDELLRTTTNDRICCLTAGATPPNPGELLGSKKMAELLQKATEHFDHVIIDSAPLGPVADSLALSTFVDGVIFVIGSNTPRQAVRSIRDRLRLAGVNILGVVLNQVDVNRGGYGYGYGDYTSNGYYREDQPQEVEESSQPAA